MSLLNDWEPMNDTRWVSTNMHIMCVLPTILTEIKQIIVFLTFFVLMISYL